MGCHGSSLNSNAAKVAGKTDRNYEPTVAGSALKKRSSQKFNDPNDPDHWFEVELHNRALFENLSLEGCKEVLPGRLFTTRMPRNLDKDEDSADKFQEKVAFYKLNTVLILTETEEYSKYAGQDLEEFYRSIPLEIIHRPIADFKIPNHPDMVANIKDLTWRLAEGKNCLVHCAGGNGRTGMVIAGIVRNLGVTDAVQWIRKVKGKYAETKEQEAFVETLPPVLDAKIAKKHPILAKAIAAEQILDFISTNKEVPWATRQNKGNLIPPPIDISKQIDFNLAFDLIDEDKSGSISLSELLKLFQTLGATVTKEEVTQFLKSDNDGLISKQEFILAMSSITPKSKRMK
eukprot:gene4526-6391_t